MRLFILFLLLSTASVFAETDVQFFFANQQYGLTQTTNRLVTLQGVNYSQAGIFTLLNFQSDGYTDTNGQITFSNLDGSAISGYYRVVVPYTPTGGQTWSGYIWVQSTSLGLINGNTIFINFPPSTIPQAGASYTAGASDARYAPFGSVGGSSTNAVVTNSPAQTIYGSLTIATNLNAGGTVSGGTISGTTINGVMGSFSGGLVNTGGAGIVSASGAITNQYSGGPVSSVGGFQTTAGGTYKGTVDSTLSGTGAFNTTGNAATATYATNAGTASTAVSATSAATAGLATNVVSGISISNATVSGTFTGNGSGINGYAQTNLINDDTWTSIVSNTAVVLGTNWNTIYAEPWMTNFQVCGTILPFVSQDAFDWKPAYIQTIAAGPAGEQAFGANYSFGMDGTNVILNLGDNDNGWTFSVQSAVDPKPVFSGYLNNRTNNTGNNYDYQITFATPARRILTFYNAFPIYSVSIPVTNNFYLTRQAQTHTLAMFGDSWIEQAYNGSASCLGMGCQLQNMRPDLNVISLGEGGTGFLAVGGTGGTNYPARIADVVACNPEYILLWGSMNDQGFISNTSLTNQTYINCTNVLFQLKVKCPYASMIFIGPQETGTPIGGSYYLLSTLYSLACQAAGVPYYSPLAQPWITGQYNVLNSGNADIVIDPATGHPSIPIGSTMLANKINEILVTNTSPVYPNYRPPVMFTNIANVFGGSFTGNGSKLTNLLDTNLTSTTATSQQGLFYNATSGQYQPQTWAITNSAVGVGQINALIPITTLNTNASFTFAQPINLVAGQYNQPIVEVTNSSGALITITPNVSWHSVGTWNCTNWSRVFLDCIPGFTTNALCVPVW